MDLAEHLLAVEAAPVSELRSALLLHTKHALPFPVALRDASPLGWEQAALELERRFGACVEATEPDAELLAMLPPRLCSRLLAYPLGQAPSTGVVDVLAVDPMDALITVEFAHHLQKPVRVLRGDYGQVTSRLSGLGAPASPATRRQDGRRMNLDERPTQYDSLPPIPLVRLAPIGASTAPGTARGVAPPAGLDTPKPGPVRVVVPRPVGDSTAAVVADAGSTVAGTPSQVADTTDLLHPGAMRLSLTDLAADELDAALGQLAVAEEPDQVVAALAMGMAPMCEEVLVFAVRADVLSSRARLNYAGQVERFSDLEVERTRRCTVVRALSEGQCVQPPEPDDLLLFVGQPAELCATRVSVHGKPALVFAAGGFADAFEASRRADRLARAASDALSRIVRARKR